MANGDNNDSGTGNKLNQEKELLDILKKQLNVKEQSQQNLVDEVNNLKMLLEESDNVAASAERRRSLAEAENELNLKLLNSMREKIVKGERLNDLEKQVAETLGSQDETYEDILDKIEDRLEKEELLKKGSQDLNRELNETLGVSGKVAQEAAKFAAAQKEGKVAQLGLSKALKVSNLVFSKMFTVAKNMIFEYDSALKGFQRTTGNIFGSSMNKQIEASAKEFEIYGASVKEATASQIGLLQTVTDFTMMNEGQQKQLRDTGVRLQALGVGLQDYQRGVQSSIKFYSQTPEMAERTSRELQSAAKQMGVLPSQMAADYAKMGPSLAKFGSEASQTFKELARIQRLQVWKWRVFFGSLTVLILLKAPQHKQAN